MSWRPSGHSRGATWGLSQTEAHQTPAPLQNFAASLHFGLWMVEGSCWMARFTILLLSQKCHAPSVRTGSVNLLFNYRALWAVIRWRRVAGAGFLRKTLFGGAALCYFILAISALQLILSGNKYWGTAVLEVHKAVQTGVFFYLPLSALLFFYMQWVAKVFTPLVTFNSVTTWSVYQIQFIYIGSIHNKSHLSTIENIHIFY